MSRERRVLLLDVLDTVVVDPLLELLPAFFGQPVRTLLPQLADERWKQFERNEIDEAALLRGLFRDERPFDHARFVAELDAAYRFVPGMEALLQRLTASPLEVHLISNYGVWYRTIEQRLRLTRFARWSFVSCETRLRKPDPRAFHNVCSVLARRPQDILFVDDSRRNCAAARELGMTALHFTDAASLEAELVRLGLLERAELTRPTATRIEEHRPTADPHDYQRDVEKMMERFTKALAAGDAEEISTFYSDDATMMPQGMPPIRGRDAIRLFWQMFIDAGSKAHEMKIVSLEGSGDLAYELGEWIGVAPVPPEWTLQEVTIKYCSIWRWENGVARLVVDTFSANTS